MKKQSYFIGTILLFIVFFSGCQQDSIANYPKSNLRSLVSFIIQPALNSGNVWNTYIGDIDQDQKLIKLTIHNGVDLTKIRPEIIVAPWATSMPGNLEPIDLTPDTVLYKVVAQSGKTATYSIVKKIIPYTGANIFSVYFPSILDATGSEIRQANTAIGTAITSPLPAPTVLTVKVPAGTDITNVVPFFELAPNSHNCTFDKPINIAYDFTNPVSFTVLSEDGKTAFSFTVQLIY